MNDETLSMFRTPIGWVGRFRCMASPCEVHIDTQCQQTAEHLCHLAMGEARRIEARFSRYRKGSTLWDINHSRGASVTVDDETARLLDFAQTCFEFSEGLFDITSGILGSVWSFDGSDVLPDEASIHNLLSRVGWQNLRWQAPQICMPVGMQLDLGGIGKEYAVDRCVDILKAKTDAAFLVNYGGDLHASAPPSTRDAWCVGIEATSSSTHAVTIELRRGALSTSGDAQRYVYRDGVRFGHVLNPHTGWPTPNAPASVTVAGNTCIEAGIFSTLAILKGEAAEAFLEEHGINFWCQR